MADQEMPYFKFVTALIDRGLWALMSPAARALYPVLLRFSDRNFKPVYPGTQRLMELTGFKQKGSLRKARKELVDMGLISLTQGTGRKNTCYHFRFDWGDARETPTGVEKESPAGHQKSRHPETLIPSGGSPLEPPYNQIHININNHVPGENRGAENGEDQELEFLRKRFGKRSVDLAISECQMGGIPETLENLKQILYGPRENQSNSWDELQKYLSEKISPGSLALIQQSFVESREGCLVFQEPLPEYLKSMIRKIYPESFFEPAALRETVSTKTEFWNRLGVDL